MYKKSSGQITLAEFYTPFGKLDPNNRWVKLFQLIDWERHEQKYASQFCEDNGAPAKPFRMALGALIIKQMTKASDDETLQMITENPYMQYFIGLHEFTTKEPFVSSMMVNFRKRITPEMLAEINEATFAKKDDEKGNPPNPTGGNSDETTAGVNANTIDDAVNLTINEGTLMLDATCAPANIAYPTDINLLNEAREKLESIIDTLHEQTGNKVKPRTYRRKARQAYLRFVKQRKPHKSTIRRATGQQLRYVARDLKHVDKLLQTVSLEALSLNQRIWLETIRILYKQQEHIYRQRTHTVERRIVSIEQPHVRPTVRGKMNAQTEFGAKVSISLADGYAFIDKLSWEAYNVESLLRPAIEAYRERFGHYPEAVLADKIYRNHENRSYCKQHGIRLSGPRLGRPPKEFDKTVLKQERHDCSDRNAVEGKFGEGKTRYCLDRIMDRLMNTSETVISLVFFCMNLKRRLRVLYCLLLDSFEYMFLFAGFEICESF